MKAAVLGSPLSDDVISILSSVPGLPPFARDVLADPALPVVLDLVEQVVEEEASRPSSPSTGPGVGLSSAVFPLRAFLFYRQHPVVVWAGAVSLLVVPFLLGALVGRSRAC